jgi:hypothetical protein
MVIMYADFSAAAVAPQVDVGDACASFQEQFEFLEPAKFISFVGDNDSKLKLGSMSTCLRLSRPDQTFAMLMMMMMMMAVIAMVVVVVMAPMVVAVITMAPVVVMAPMVVAVITMAPLVAMIAVFAVRVSFVVMSFAVAMFVAAFGTMLML